MGGIRRFLTLVLITTASFAASADPTPPPAPVPPTVLYDCQVILIAKDVPTGSATFKYPVTAANDGPHGGQEYPFEAGNNKITTVSNDRWLGINWFRKGILVAATVFARSDANTASEALISVNPADQDEQISLDCSKH